MGEVVELWSVGSFRAMFLIEEWQRLVEQLRDYEKATSAHLSLCRDWEQIWGVEDPEKKPDQAERVRQLSDQELLDEWHACEPDNEVCELIVGEMERRNLDD
jgi:hypothetical protein